MLYTTIPPHRVIAFPSPGDIATPCATCTGGHGAGSATAVGDGSPLLSGKHLPVCHSKATGVPYGSCDIAAVGLWGNYSGGGSQPVRFCGKIKWTFQWGTYFLRPLASWCVSRGAWEKPCSVAECVGALFVENTRPEAVKSQTACDWRRQGTRLNGTQGRGKRRTGIRTAGEAVPRWAMRLQTMWQFTSFLNNNLLSNSG